MVWTVPAHMQQQIVQPPPCGLCGEPSFTDPCAACAEFLRSLEEAP